MSNEIVPMLDLSDREIDRALLGLIPKKILHKHRVVPISRRGTTITIATPDPTNIFAADEIKFITGFNVEMVVAKRADIEHLLGIESSSKTEITPLSSIESMEHSEAAADDLLGMDNFEDLISGAVDDLKVVAPITVEEPDHEEVDAPVIKLSNTILLKAISLKVSDIHLEPFEKVFRVRFRFDGVLKTVMTLPFDFKSPITSRIKIMANMDISEKRLPQDGRIKLKLKDHREVDFRVSSLPTMYGEKIVLRLLDEANLTLDLSKIGFSEEALKDFRESISQPWGMVLVTGPTGSGKTTTLYSALKELNSEECNIMTAEDPIEYNLMGINQVQVQEQIGLTFASTLRSFLRQDPDIIFVGEIRDYETAEIAIKVSMTGHLLLSTLHTNDAPSTINRLVNIGVEPFLIASSLNLVLAQRLVRQNCTQCRVAHAEPAENLIKLGVPLEELQTFTAYRGQGCNYCGKLGFKGRSALFEVMPIRSDIQDMISLGATATELREKAIENGMDTLRMSGLKKVRTGDLSIKEIFRTTKA